MRKNVSHLVELVNLVNRAKESINQVVDIASLDNIRSKYLGRKGYLTLKINILRKLPPEKRSEAGAIINAAKEQIQKAISIRKIELEKTLLNTRLMEEKIDISLSGRRIENGNLHPVTRTIDRVENFFFKLGFTVTVGLEIEDDYHNFDALNISSQHPARTNRDTFWFNKTYLLRTQISGMQVRIMRNKKPPIRIISPGRVYRNDYDHTHTPMFHQIEGLVVDKNISFINLKGILNDFLCYFFEKNLKINFRASYFPFTEPSAEVDILSENGKWIEVLGCGMVHPNVLNNVRIDSEVYSGFAFGIGVERLTMLRYGLTDMRAFFENDLRFLRQFK